MLTHMTSNSIEPTPSAEEHVHKIIAICQTKNVSTLGQSHFMKNERITKLNGDKNTLQQGNHFLG